MSQDNVSAVVIGIAEDAEIEGPENMKFSINGTGAFADVVILGQEESTPIETVSKSNPQFKESLYSHFGKLFCRNINQLWWLW